MPICSSIFSCTYVGISMPLNIIMELRKIANHPLLVRHHYTHEILRHMSQHILNEPSYHNADPNLVYEDMTVMTDFELHQLCLSYSALKAHCLPQTAFKESGKLKYLEDKLDQLKTKVRYRHRVVFISNHSNESFFRVTVYCSSASLP